MVFTPNHAESRWIMLNHTSYAFSQAGASMKSSNGSKRSGGKTAVSVTPSLFHCDSWIFGRMMMVFFIKCHAMQGRHEAEGISSASTWKRYLSTCQVHYSTSLACGITGKKTSKPYINASKNLHTLSPPRLHMLYVIFKIIPPLPQCGTRPLHFSHSDLFFIETRN